MIENNFKGQGKKTCWPSFLAWQTMLDKKCVCVCVYLHLLHTPLIRHSCHHSRWLIIVGRLFSPPCKAYIFFSISFVHVPFFELQASLVKKLFVTRDPLTSTWEEGLSTRARVISAHICCPSSVLCILSALLPSQCFCFFFYSRKRYLWTYMVATEEETYSVRNWLRALKFRLCR